MRYLRYNASGRPSALASRNLNELAMLTEAAISVTNVVRWAQERVAQTALEREAERAKGDAVPSVVPADIAQKAKTKQYETSVVDQFVQLGAQSFASHGTEAVWERPMPTGKRGRPQSIDVSLFNARRGEESRIEFGEYSRKKLRDDAKKLGKLSQAGGLIITNYLILWRTRETKLSGKSVDQWRTDCVADAKQASVSGKFQVALRLVSSQDLFVAFESRERVLDLALFSLQIDGHNIQEPTGDI